MLNPSDTILTVSFTYIYNWNMISCKMSLINVGQLLACWQTKTTYITIQLKDSFMYLQRQILHDGFIFSLSTGSTALLLSFKYI